MAYGRRRYGRRRRFGRRRRRNNDVWSRRNIGHRVGTTTTKAYEVVKLAGNFDTRDLRQHNMTLIPKTTDNDVNERQRNIANIRGFKIYMQVGNLGAQHLTFNVAVISPKDTRASVISTTDFFRDPTSNDRALSFTDARDNIQFSKYGINPDLYTVLRHKRYYLNASVLSTEDQYDNGGNAGDSGFKVSFPNLQRERGANFKSMEWWVPLKRQLRWTGGTANNESRSKVWLVYWVDQFGADATSISITNACALDLKIHTFFREPKP